MNERFVKKGERVTYCGFPEPFISVHSNKLFPGLEIFKDCVSKPEFFAYNDRTFESEGGEDDTSFAELFNDRREPDDQVNQIRRRLQELFTTATSPEMLIFLDGERSDEDEERLLPVKEEF